MPFSRHRTFTLSLIILFLAVYPSFSQRKKSKAPLFKLGDQGYYEDEFRYYFFKNNNELSKDSAKIKVDEYLNLYVNFRLKVQEAIALGKDKEEAFILEFRKYKNKLAEPFLVESKLTEEMVQTTYARMQEERLASHILIKLPKAPTPVDTLRAYNKIVDIRNKYEQGEPFDSLARKFSEDPSARVNYGSLGYFSAMRMVLPFEEAVFTTEVGNLTGPIRTNFGYHLIRVEDKRPARGKLQTAHIMIRTTDKMDQSQLDLAKGKIESVYAKLQSGEDWKELCSRYSDDHNTRKRGGALNWFGTSDNMVAEFKEAAFELDTAGSISKPVKTAYGWHIIKLLAKKELEPFDKIRSKIESTLSRETHARFKKEKAVAMIKSANSFALNLDNQQLALDHIDSTLLQGKWSRDSSSTEGSKELFSLDNTKFTIDEFWKYAESRQAKRSHSDLAGYKAELYNRFEEKSIFDFEEDHLFETNDDYRLLLGEYKNGILLFNLMEVEVWQKAQKDSVGLKAYYEANADRFYREEMADARIFVSEKSELLDQAEQFLDHTKNEIDSIFNKTEPLALQLFENTYEKGDDELVDKYWNEGEYRHEDQGKHYLLYIKEIIPGGVKPLDETKGAVISAYQEEVEHRWIEGLKKKYPVKVNKGAMKKMIAKIEAKL